MDYDAGMPREPIALRARRVMDKPILTNCSRIGAIAWQ